MALPRAKQARPFYQAAWQRFEDAQVLLRAGRTTGATYLAGYGVECMMKALVLSTLPARQQSNMADEFRGARAHSFEWLKATYLGSGGSFPLAIAREFTLVNTWSTHLRYAAGTANPQDAKAFIQAADHIISWADGRL